jgi:hypothetical protein
MSFLFHPRSSQGACDLWILQATFVNQNDQFNRVLAIQGSLLPFVRHAAATLATEKRAWHLETQWLGVHPSQRRIKFTTSWTVDQLPTSSCRNYLKDCPSGTICPQTTSERQSLEDNIGEQNSITLPSSVCAAIFFASSKESLPTATPGQGWILRYVHCAATQKKLILITSPKFQILTDNMENVNNRDKWWKISKIILDHIKANGRHLSNWGRIKQKLFTNTVQE